MRRFVALVMLQGQFPNIDMCEQFIEEEDWYHRDDSSKKVVPIFPHLQKMQVKDHHYFGYVITDDAIADTSKEVCCQVLLEVMGYSATSVEEELFEGDWIKHGTGLKVIDPVLILKGFKDDLLPSIAWKLHSN